MTQHERDLIVGTSIAQQPSIFRGLASSGLEAGVAHWQWEVLEASIRVQGTVDQVAGIVENSIRRIGTPQPDEDGLTTVVGTGWRSLNPAVVTITASSGDTADGVELAVRCLSGEGLIKQHGAVKAFDRLVADLRTTAPVTIDSVSTSIEGRAGAAAADVRLQVAVALTVLLLWIAAVLARVIGGGSLGWLTGAFFFVGLAISIVATVLRRRSRDRRTPSA